MLTANEIEHKLGTTFTKDQIQALTEVLGEVPFGLATSVDMQDLKDAVKGLTIAQEGYEDRAKERFTRYEERSEERFTRIESAIANLTVAQERSEERLDRVESAIEKLTTAQAQSGERLDRVESAIEKLTAAQVRSEKQAEKRFVLIEAAIRELTTENKITRERIETLADNLDALVNEHRKTRTQLGGLSNTVGYTLENAAYRALPALLKADHGIEIQDRLLRTYLQNSREKFVEVNIFGKGLKDGREVVIIGESKSQLSVNHISHFVFNILHHLRPQYEEVLPVMVTHMISSEGVAAYAEEQGIALYYSYQF